MGANDTIFISRAGADSDVAVRVAGILRLAGYEVILQDLTFGHQGFMSRMQDALASGARVIALLSKDYLASDNCQAEWQGALVGDPLNRKQRLMVFRVGACDPSGLLAQIPFIELSDVLDRDAEFALRALKAVGPGPKSKIRGAAESGPIMDSETQWEVPSFTGRGKALADLRKALRASGEVAVTQTTTVHGMGGVGKSTLAKEYARRNRTDYAIVWWINAEKEEGIVDGYVRLGARFDPDIAQERDRTSAAREIRSKIFGALKKPALLVFDNVEDRSLVAKWRPQENSHVLVTSRLHGWGKGFAAIEIEKWPPDEARDYLLAESDRGDIATEDASKIAETLGYLPLALAHAAAFLRDNPAVTAARYVARTDELMDSVPEGADHSKAAVYATFQQALAAAEKRGAGAASILCLASFFAPDDIPFELFEQKPKEYPADLAPVFEDGPVAAPLRAALENEAAREQGLSALAALSLIDLKQTTRSFSAHRLVQAACRDLVVAAREDWSAAAVGAANATFPSVEFNDWPLCDRLAPHVEALARLVPDSADAKLGRLLNQTGFYLGLRAEFDRAKSLHRRALAIDEKNFGPDHPGVATDLNNLALLLHETNRFEEAERLLNRALGIDEKNFGPEHFEVATDLNNLASLLHETKRSEEAEPLFRRALAIDENSFGPDHRKVATDLNNLASLLRETGRFEEAEPLFRRALAIHEKSLGPDHPDVASGLANLAILLSQTRQYEESELLSRRSLEIREKGLGSNHPDLANSLYNLAGLLVITDRLSEAVPMSERAATICVASLGEDHPHTKLAKAQATRLRAQLDKS